MSANSVTSKRSLPSASAAGADADAGAGEEKKRQKRSQVDLGPQLKVTDGMRIEVRWVLAAQDDGQQDEAQLEEERVWWGASITKVPGAAQELNDEAGSEQVQVYEVVYDARLPEFPDQEVQRVCLAGRHTLYDFAEDAAYMWRIEGEEWEEDEDEGEGDEDQEKGDLKTSVEGNVSSLLDRYRADQVREGDTWVIPTDQAETFAEEFANVMVERILTAHSKKLEGLPASTQHAIIDKVQRAKVGLVARLIQAMRQRGSLDSAAVADIIAGFQGEVR